MALVSASIADFPAVLENGITGSSAVGARFNWGVAIGAKDGFHSRRMLRLANVQNGNGNEFSALNLNEGVRVNDSAGFAVETH